MNPATSDNENETEFKELELSLPFLLNQRVLFSGSDARLYAIVASTERF